MLQLDLSKDELVNCVNSGYIIDKFSYSLCYSKVKTLFALVLSRGVEGLFMPVSEKPAGSVLYVLYNHVQRIKQENSSDVRVVCPGTGIIDFNNLSGVDLGYKTGEHYRNQHDIICVGRELRIDPFAVLCLYDPLSLEKEVGRILTNNEFGRDIRS